MVGVYTTGGDQRTLAGATVLRFGPDDRVVEHTDYWAEDVGRRPRVFR
jgi:hypothetical protein